ncbi:hypothetical protein P7C70_g6505, partial [Phenoliferia sp. Uapishka_3]
MTTLAAKWTRLSLLSAPPLHLSSHSLAVINSNAYIFGGELSPRTPVSADLTIINLLDRTTRILSPPSTSSWPSPRVGASLVSSGSKLYLWGGRGGKDMGTFGEEEDVWAFDVESEKWEALETTGERPQQRSFHVLTAAGDTLFLHAGCPPKGRLSTLHSLSLKTLAWSSLPSAPGPGRGGTVLAPIGNSPHSTLVRFGGFAGFELGGPLDVYDVDRKEWSTGVEVAEGGGPEKRSVHGLVGLSGVKVQAEGKEVVAVMFMGEREGAPAELGHDGAGAFHSDAWALISSTPSSATTSYTPASLSWIPLPVSKSSTEAPEARGWFASSAFGDDKIVVHGGLNEKNERLDDLWSLEVVQE